MSALDELGIAVQIQARPNEVDPAIPFADDHTHASYDPNAVHLFWRQLVSADHVMHEFRSHFIGKVSPVHFFWGAMDLACTRFSGRTAIVKVANSWVIMNPGGGPTSDKPDITLTAPEPGDPISSFLNVRVTTTGFNSEATT
jgi:Family of unknown function (DUF5996)